MMIVSVFHIHAFIINKVSFVNNMYHLQSANCKFLFFFLFQDATLPPKWIAFRTIIFNEKVCVYWIWITNLLPWQKKKGSYAQCTLKFGDLYLTFIIRFWFLKYDAWYPSLSLIFFMQCGLRFGPNTVWVTLNFVLLGRWLPWFRKNCCIWFWWLSCEYICEKVWNINS